MNYQDVLKYRKILYVEDDSIVRESTYDVLKLFFQEITVASDGESALSYLNDSFDIIILDLKLPKINGIELAKRFREKHEHSLIFMISSYQEIADLKEALRIGMIDYLSKPLQFDELQKTLMICAQKLSKNIIFTLGDNIIYNIESKTLFQDDKIVNLTKNEMLFVELILKYKNRILSYDVLSQEIFNTTNTDVTIGSIKNLLLRLRKKLNCKIVENIFGIGYRVL